MATKVADRRAISNLGIYVYGAGAIALGVIGLVWTDFANNWQRVQGNVPSPALAGAAWVIAIR
jgi:hypothetical protein